jgi:hypothetical protein
MRFFTIVIFCLLTAGAQAAPNEREARELKLSEQLIIMSSIRAANPTIQELCLKHKPICEGTDQREIALSLIGARNSEISMISLINLLRFNLDGAGGETRTCYILQNGEQIYPLLSSSSGEKLASQCSREVSEIGKNAGLGKVKIKDICTNKLEISRQKDELLKAIKRNEKCAPEDF